MKKVSVFLVLVICTSAIKSQTVERFGLIDVPGYAKVMVVPDAYKAQILIQEEEQKIGYQTIGKLSIDSIKINLFNSLKKFNIEEKELKLIGTSSQALGQYPNFLINIAYELQLKQKEQAQRLVNELRLPGLKGIVIKAQYTKASQRTQELLYDSALSDAHSTAILLAKKSDKTVGAVKNILIQDRQIPSMARDSDSYVEVYNAYSISRFEMDLRDKFATCNVRVSYELK